MSGQPLTGPRPNGAAVAVDHVADRNHCYPGEVVRLLTRVRIHGQTPPFEVRVQLPPGVEVDSYRSLGGHHFPVFRQLAQRRQRAPRALPGSDGEPFPIAVHESADAPYDVVETSLEMVWRVENAPPEGGTYQYEADLLILPVEQPVALRSEAVVVVAVADEDADEAVDADEEGGDRSTHRRIAGETAEVQIAPKGRYLNYLPALYEQDAFMGRYLMLFESFWAPIEKQIDQIEHYFDPDLTPPRFLPWLASWFELSLDGTWSEEQQRELVRSVMWLYRRRGTRVALQRYLEILTRRPVEILERRAKNFTLGSKGRLGVGVALGTGNIPHTFTVRVRMPPVPEPRGMPKEKAEQEVARQTAMRRDLLERLIDAEKPAHTSYVLEILPDAA